MHKNKSVSWQKLKFLRRHKKCWLKYLLCENDNEQNSSLVIELVFLLISNRKFHNNNELFPGNKVLFENIIGMISCFLANLISSGLHHYIFGMEPNNELSLT